MFAVSSIVDKNVNIWLMVEDDNKKFKKIEVIKELDHPGYQWVENIIFSKKYKILIVFYKEGLIQAFETISRNFTLIYKVQYQWNDQIVQHNYNIIEELGIVIMLGRSGDYFILDYLNAGKCLFYKQFLEFSFNSSAFTRFDKQIEKDIVLIFGSTKGELIVCKNYMNIRKKIQFDQAHLKSIYLLEIVDLKDRANQKLIISSSYDRVSKLFCLKIDDDNVYELSLLKQFEIHIDNICRVDVNQFVYTSTTSKDNNLYHLDFDDFNQKDAENIALLNIKKPKVIFQNFQFVFQLQTNFQFHCQNNKGLAYNNNNSKLSHIVLGSRNNTIQIIGIKQKQQQISQNIDKQQLIRKREPDQDDDIKKYQNYKQKKQKKK